MITLEDLLVASRTVYGEARGESFKGQRAVMHVILNRVGRSNRDHSVASVCLRGYQFSCWNRKDPNRDKLLSVDVSSDKFRRALCAVLTAIDEPDFTDNARHYLTRARRTQGWPRSWGEVREPCFKLGDHLFFNNVK